MNTSVNCSSREAAARIRELAPQAKPRLGIVLGSGLGSFADSLTDSIVIPYHELPGFPHTSVQGHKGNMVIGKLHGVEIACLQGRAHGYEGDSSYAIRTYVRTLKLLGCDYFIATNASGSLREDVGPGELMLITDHINMQPTNPLVGQNDDDFGSRFYPLDKAYCPELREKLSQIALEENINLNTGVYISVLGPHFETAAEIRAFRILGADAVGMSTVPEVLVANHCGMKVGVIATITNYATGLAQSSHSHEAVLMTAEQAAEKLKLLLEAFVKSL